MKIIMIAAMDQNQGIGLNGTMPWHCPADLRHFRDFTMGKTLLMGRKTWQGLPVMLQGRRVIVMTSDPHFTDCEHFSSMEQALQWIHHQPEDQSLIIAGGAQLYRQWMPYADMMILSRIDGIYDCDTFFPEWDRESWKKSETVPCEGFILETWKRTG